MCLLHVALIDKIPQKFKIVEASEERVRSCSLAGWNEIVRKAMVGRTSMTCLVFRNILYKLEQSPPYQLTCCSAVDRKGHGTHCFAFFQLQN